ncbi:hypothetical protein COOONC_10583 [Cooperia oncophora]
MEDVPIAFQQRKLTSSGYSGPTSRRSASGNASKRSGDNKENELASRYRNGGNQGTAKHSSIVKRSSLPTESNASEDESRGCSSEGRPEPDPSLRRVDQYVPGKLLYRHDPVKKFELYREEWARRPAIGEEKRLALRWKVREYMLRESLPTHSMSRFLIRQQEKFVQALGKHNIPGLRWLLEGFNYYDISRVKEVGPDRAAAEWIVRCGGAVKFDKIADTFNDYNALIKRCAELDPRVPADNVKVTHIHAVDASVTGYGCRHFAGLSGIKEVEFVRCDNLHDFGLEYMAKAVGAHLELLKIDGCRRITEFGLAHLEKCRDDPGKGVKSAFLRADIKLDVPEPISVYGTPLEVWMEKLLGYSRRM